MLLARLSDGTGFITLRFFHFSNAQKEQLKRGVKLLCYGEVRRGKAGLEMAHPEYQFIKENEDIILDENLSPIYPTTEGVHQLTLRNVMSQVIDKLKKEELKLPALIPAALLKKYHWPEIKDALLYIHNPPIDAKLEELSEGKHLTQQSLIVEELLAHHLSMRQLRISMQKEKAPALKKQTGLIKQLHWLC